MDSLTDSRVITEPILLWLIDNVINRQISDLVIVHTASLLLQEHSKSILWRNFL